MVKLRAAMFGSVLPLLLGAAINASAEDATGASAAPAPQLEEIVVTGLRASLEKSLDDKRKATVVEDSIDSTELGRFPDADVADSLNHLPGITISRTTGGEGQKVSVRGLGPQYNIVTLNNRVLATDDDGRDLAFDVLPSEVISGADVLKSSQASALEGSIGGTVNLKTASPFDSPGLHGGVHAEGNYNTMSELYGQKYSGFISNTIADGKLGFLVGLVHSDTKTRTDSLNAFNQDYYGPTTYPFDGSGNPVTIGAVPCCITFGSIFDEKKRDALTGTLEWRPSENLTITGDALYTRLRDPQRGYNQSYYFDYGVDQNGNPTWTNPTIANGLITGVTVSNFQPEIVNNTINRNVTTGLYGLKASWKPSSTVTLDADLYRSTANRPEGGTDTFVTAGLVSDQPYAEDTLIFNELPHSLPSLNVLIPPSQLGLTACPTGTASATSPGQCSYTALMNSGYLNDNKYWSTHYDGLNGYSVHDDVTSFALDGKWDANAGALTRLKFGAGEMRREKTRADVSNDWTNGSGQYGFLYNTAGCPIQCDPYSFGSQGFNVLSFTSPPHFMQGAGGSYPSILPALNVTQLLAFMQSLNGKPNPFYCQTYPTQCDPPYTNFNLADTLPVANPFNSYDVVERTTSFYVEAELAGERWNGNAGVRVVHTTTDASYAESVPISLWTPSTASSTQTWNVQYSAGGNVTSHGSYTLALPSVNFSLWVLPQTLQLRTAVAETMARPDLNQLAPNATNQAINGTPELDYSGAVGLKPIKAWNEDISLEWYYQPHSALNVAVFAKQIRDDIFTKVDTNVDLGTMQYVGGPPGTVPGTPFLWTITSPANGAKGTLGGAELSWQHFLDNGLGTHVQYTHTWSHAVNSVPPTTISLSLIYDKGPVSADVTWDHTASYNYFCSQCTEVPGWPAIADSSSWLTASVHYKPFKGFDVYVEGKNLSNSIARTYLNGNPLLPWAPGQAIGQDASGVGAGYSAYGRTFVAGLSYSL